MIELPIAWLLSTIGLLGGVIATLAGIIYTSLSARLAAQDKIIDHLRLEVERMGKGCGQRDCLWRGRE